MSFSRHFQIQNETLDKRKYIFWEVMDMSWENELSSLIPASSMKNQTENGEGSSQRLIWGETQCETPSNT